MENQKEIWKEVKEYEGLYEVSNFGRVRSLDRTRKALNNSIAKLTGRILSPGVVKSGYLTVALTKEGKAKTFTIHQLVAIAFLNHKPCGYKLIVDHRDNNPLNNTVDNLQIVTQRKNSSKDQFRFGRNSQYVGVCWHITRKRWYASLTNKGIRYNLGSFINEYDAHLAYQNKLKEIQQDGEL